jgi:hypothetical protein
MMGPFESYLNWRFYSFFWVWPQFPDRTFLQRFDKAIDESKGGSEPNNLWALNFAR